MVSDGVELFDSGRVSQATVTETGRSVAEVLAQVQAARALPRDIVMAEHDLRQACLVDGFAERAFFRFPRGGSTVSGPSVHLARELARCWGHIDYGVKELARDHEQGQSEMLAFAWDMQANVRASTMFLVPHARDKKDPKTGDPVTAPLVSMRDVYENNANQGARRLRQSIFSVLPPWFTEKAIELCRVTIRDGGGVPLPERIVSMLSKFREIGVSEDDIAYKLGGRPNSRWTEDDVAMLGVVYQSLQRGETRREDEFPSPLTQVEDLTPGEGSQN